MWSVIEDEVSVFGGLGAVLDYAAYTADILVQHT